MLQAQGRRFDNQSEPFTVWSLHVLPGQTGAAILMLHQRNQIPKHEYFKCTFNPGRQNDTVVRVRLSSPSCAFSQ